MKIFEFLDKKAVTKLKKEIKAASGNEVFFRGIPDEEGIVTDIEVIARGNEYSVAAVLNRMKKNEIIIHNHPSGLLVPSDNDVQISSVYGELGGGSYIVNNEVNDISGYGISLGKTTDFGPLYLTYSNSEKGSHLYLNFGYEF